ncbi:MAG: TadE/TadG family type IV pilus assembly protein [Candidatus Gastranaerophilales bacterium]|nr:TadE/TadG family type IV pilus assembly protein [Candidatus Gastranaerophilales bacterium]
MKRNAQSLIEFVFVAPLLIFVLFGIIELALFWKTANTVQEIALQSAISASGQIVDGTQTSTTLMDSEFNVAAKSALMMMQNRISSLNLNYSDFDLQDFDVTTDTDAGDVPYTIYTFESKSIDSDVNKSVITLIVDYQNPYTKGICTQIVYQYRTVLLGAEFTLPNGRKISIIPKNIEISSSKIQQYNQY